MSGRIKTLRGEIDAIDEKILSLLNKRISFVKKIGKLKEKKGIESFDPAREESILSKIARLNSKDTRPGKFEPVFKEIFSLSRSFEKPFKVAYLGPEGSFTHLAALKYFGENCNYMPAKRIQDVFELTEKQECELGVVPIENSNEGTVGLTLDMLVDSNIKLCGEIYQEIALNLIGKDTDLSGIKKIYSHAQALAQCRLWLDRNMPGVNLMEVESTSEAARRAAENPSSAAIASAKSAEIYGLSIINSRIEDGTSNYTRFIILGKSSAGLTGKDKTSVIISLPDESGSLYYALGAFSKYKINLSKIESRPIKKKAWEYLFFIDFDGHVSQKVVKKTISELVRICLSLKVLGSYPRSR